MPIGEEHFLAGRIAVNQESGDVYVTSQNGWKVLGERPVHPRLG